MTNKKCRCIINPRGDFMEKENCLNEVAYPLQKRAEIVQWILVSALIFIVPMLVPQ